MVLLKKILAFPCQASYRLMRLEGTPQSRFPVAIDGENWGNNMCRSSTGAGTRRPAASSVTVFSRARHIGAIFSTFTACHQDAENLFELAIRQHHAPRLDFDSNLKLKSRSAPRRNLENLHDI